MDGELYHYGVKGMKWYQHIFGKLDNRGKYKEKAESSNNKKENVKTMTDEDLRKRIERLRMESEYKRLVKDLQPEEVKKGESFLTGVLKESGKELAMNFAKGYGSAKGKIVAERSRNQSSGNSNKGKKGNK